MWGGRPRPPLLKLICYFAWNRYRTPTDAKQKVQVKSGGQECPPHTGSEKSEEEVERKSNFQSRGRHFMEEVPGVGSGSRRNEDIALDLMKFVAMTTGYGRTTSSGVGFQGSGAAAKPEEYAGHLLELYGKCLQAVAGKKK